MSHISRFLGLFREISGILGGFLDFASIKFCDFSQIARIARFNNKTLSENKVLCHYKNDSWELQTIVNQMSPNWPGPVRENPPTPPKRAPLI